MIYTKFVFGIVVILLVIYYVMIIGQLFGFWKITNQKLKFIKLCIPFYYWIKA